MNYNIVEENFFKSFQFFGADHNVNKCKRVNGIPSSFDGLT